MLGRCHKSLPTSITLGLRSIEETLAEAKEKVGKGFSVLKVKLGQDLEFDLELLQRLRAELPQEILLRVDPNQGYDLQALQALLAKFDELRLEFVEQPVPVSETEQLHLCLWNNGSSWYWMKAYKARKMRCGMGSKILSVGALTSS